MRRSSGGPQAERRATAVVYALALFMSTLDLTIVNVALPTIGQDLGMPIAALSGISTGYLAAVAAVISAAAWLEDRLGGRRALLLSIAVFTVASVLCGAAPNGTVLVGARVLQGAGGGLLAPVGLGLLYRVYRGPDRVRVTAMTSLVTGLAPILGPTLGGLLAGSGSWRLIFLVNAPIGVAALVYGARSLPRVARPAARSRFDVAAFALVSSGLVLLILGLSEGAAVAWRSPGPLVAVLIGGVLLAAFVRVTHRRASPLLRLALVNSRPFGPGVAVVLLANASFFGALYVIALYLQNALHLAPAAAGLLMLAEAVPVIVGAQVTTRILLPRRAEHDVLLAGLLGVVLVLLALSAFDLAAMPPALAIPLFAGLLAVLGWSWSLVFIPVTIAALKSVDSDETVHATTLLSAARQIASALGIALAATILATRADGDSRMYWPAFAVLAGIAAVAAASSRRMGHAQDKRGRR